MTKARELFERELLPAFAARFHPAQLVLNLGAGDHQYRDHFTCRVVTADKAPGCDQQFAAEQIPYDDDSLAGVLMMGVFERLDDPMQAMREIRRVVKPDGYVLLSALDIMAPYQKPVDRWRLTPGGAAHVVRDFLVLAAVNVDRYAHFFVLQKAPIGGGLV